LSVILVSADPWHCRRRIDVLYSHNITALRIDDNREKPVATMRRAPRLRAKNHAAAVQYSPLSRQDTTDLQGLGFRLKRQINDVSAGSATALDKL
jgi:hypothetical protein